MEYAVYSNRGKARENNEDEYYIDFREGSDPYIVMAVADGMGGHKAGEVASSIAINYLSTHQFSTDEDLPGQIEKVITAINQRILEKAGKKEKLDNMGTTFSMGIIYRDKLYIGHIGDSRIYLYHNNKLSQLTTDHTLVNELLQQKKITEEEAFNHPRKNILTRALGLDLEIESEIKDIKLTANDFILLCTDGLSDLVRFEQIEEVFENSRSDLDLLVEKLGKKAMDNGGSDNISMIVGKYN